MNQIASTVLVGFTAGARADPQTRPADSAFRQLREEYQAQQALWEAQPLDVRCFLEDQAAQVVQALVQRDWQIHFMLPEMVAQSPARTVDGTTRVPLEFRKQVVAGLLGRLPLGDIRTAFRQRLTQLEQSPHWAVAVSASLIRYATVKHMVHDMLPTGGPVTYVVAEGDEIPTVPDSADSAAPASRRFYLPQWVAFEDGRLVADSMREAEAHVAAMQRFLSTLHLAVSLAPYIFADEEYQRKRYGMLGQLVNQGHALARYQTGVVIGKIQRRVEVHDLNRGFSLSLPYFDDQMLEMKMYDFEVIPAGRIMFVPALVWRAARREQAEVAQDMRLSHSTRMHLLAQLKALELAFDTSEPQ